MWKKRILRLSLEAKTVIDNAQRGIISPFSLSVQGVKIGVHNWTHGIEENSNRYLSPENAVNALAEKLTDYADPNRPKGQQDIVVIMVTAPTAEQFITALDGVRQLLPEPAFKQAYDYAKSAQGLAESKMVKTPTPASPAFGQAADITPGSARILQKVLRHATSGAAAQQALDPLAALNALKQLKSQRDDANRRQVDAMLQTAAPVFAFKATGLPEVAAAAMRAGIPAAGNVFTAAVMFIGNDLTPMKGMLHDLD